MNPSGKKHKNLRLRLRSCATSIRLAAAILICGICTPRLSANSEPIALWLFDETQYPHSNLTDASLDRFDLHLLEQGEMVPGKFGNALKASPGPGYVICNMDAHWPAMGLWGPIRTPRQMLEAFVGRDWTLEFWLKLPAAPKVEGMVIDMGQAYEPGFSLNLAAGGTAFVLANAYAGQLVRLPTDAAKLTDGQWHHLAFSRESAGGTVRHYLDGRLQGLPEVSAISKQPVPGEIPEAAFKVFQANEISRDYGLFRQYRFNLTIGEDRRGGKDLEMIIDELRVLGAVSYTTDFTPPGSFSINYGAHPPPPTKPWGPPLLFGSNAPAGPVRLESRKHLFIDEVLVEDKQNINLTINPPTDPQTVNMHVSAPIDHDGKVYTLEGTGENNRHNPVTLWSSQDGLKFEPVLANLIEVQGSKSNNLVLLGHPLNNQVIKNDNPSAPADERFILMGQVGMSGIYLYTSPDLIHWRRNETIALPLLCGSSVEVFSDDQRGCYVTLLKRDSSTYNHEAPRQGNRVSVGFTTSEIRKPWPFHKMKTPVFDQWQMPFASGEGPVVFGVTEFGGVYGTGATKYMWAPDVYLGFVRRFNRQEVRSTDLGVSRDGEKYTVYGSKRFYLEGGFTYEGKTIVEAMIWPGIIRRGDELWQYASLYAGAHGSGGGWTVRFKQRLDGFVSLDAGTQGGTFTTKPLIFTGDRLVLNMKANGAVRAGLLDESGKPVPGYAVEDCEALTTDSTAAEVKWKGKTSVGPLAGLVVRLKIELRDAKLYALQFVNGK